MIEQNQVTENIILRQVLWVSIGYFLMVITATSLLKLIYRYKYTLFILGILLFFILTFIGEAVNGTKVEIRLVIFNFQPFEAVKITLLIWLAVYLYQSKEVISISLTGEARIMGVRQKFLEGSFAYNSFSACSILVVVLILAIYQDLGPAILLTAFSLLMLLLFGGSNRVIGKGLFLILILMVFYHLLSAKSVTNIGIKPYQSIKALESLGGYPLIIASLLLILLLVFRLVIVGLRSDGIGKYLSIAFASMLGLQNLIVFLNIIQIFPSTVVTLPFIGYGSSAILSNFILNGLILKISSETALPTTPAYQTSYPIQPSKLEEAVEESTFISDEDLLPTMEEPVIQATESKEELLKRTYQSKDLKLDENAEGIENIFFEYGIEATIVGAEVLARLVHYYVNISGELNLATIEECIEVLVKTLKISFCRIGFTENQNLLILEIPRLDLPTFLTMEMYTRTQLESIKKY